MLTDSPGMPRPVRRHRSFCRASALEQLRRRCFDCLVECFDCLVECFDCLVQCFDCHVECLDCSDCLVDTAHSIARPLSSSCAAGDCLVNCLGGGSDCRFTHVSVLLSVLTVLTVLSALLLLSRVRSRAATPQFCLDSVNVLLTVLSVVLTVLLSVLTVLTALLTVLAVSLTVLLSVLTV